MSIEDDAKELSTLNVDTEDRLAVANKTLVLLKQSIAELEGQYKQKDGDPTWLELGQEEKIKFLVELLHLQNDQIREAEKEKQRDIPKDSGYSRIVP